jgi:hypothetical protein
MIIVKLFGGIGNQMFQYAAGRGLANRNSCELKIDISHFNNLVLPNGLPYRSFDLSIFHIRADVASEKEIKLYGDEPHSIFKRGVKKIKNLIVPYVVLNEPHFHFYPEFMKAKGNIYIEGYWQSEKYFKEIEHEIRNDFIIKTTLNQEGNRLLKKIMSTNSICLNIRRKEFATNQYINQFVGLNYICDAVELMASKIENPHFFIFSDELAWVKQNVKISHNYTIVEENLYGDKFRDCLFLMTSCKHFVIPNSTFGWWGAWLGDNPNKIVIAPKQWFRDDSKSTSDLFPENWICM